MPTKIEWCDETINPVKGLCPMGCSYCYARRMYKRFKWNTEIRFDSGVYQRIAKIPAGSKIFVGSTIELFGDWIKENWLNAIFLMAENYPEDTFIFLTKQPQNLIKWNPFPDNCWVGVSATNVRTFHRALCLLSEISAKIKFISLEPLLAWDMDCNDLYHRLLANPIHQVIIGRQTPASKKTAPKIEWIREIVEAADKAGVPVFLKDNLYDLLMSVPHEDIFWEDMSHLRQEFPKED